MTKLEAQIKQLEQATGRLKEALALESNPINQDAAIQRFEFTFELCWKLMRGIGVLKGIESVSPKDSIRTGAQLGLIENPIIWFRFLQDRNLSSHVYNEELAQDIYDDIKNFLPEAEKLLDKSRSLKI